MSGQVEKDYRPLVKAARDQGWRVESGGGSDPHLRLHPPEGGMPVKIPTSGSSGKGSRALKAKTSLLRRLGLRI